MKAVLVKDGIVENHIVWDDNSQEIPGYQYIIVADNTPIGVGWEYNAENNTFVDPLTKNPDAWMEGVPWNDLRKFSYPPIADYLDGVVKGDQTQINKYIADCLAVKAKFPKPQ